MIAALIGWALTFVARAVALRFAVFAQPSDRRRHTRPIPLLGGMAIFLTVGPLGVGALALGLPGVMGREFFPLLLGMGMVFATGVLDDWLELRARHKLLGQSLAALLVMGTEPNLGIIFNDYGVPASLGYPLTLIWVVGLTNAFNLVDGLDGLCSGLAAISAVALALILPPGFGSFTAAALAGACVGFAVHNFNPARIFLGDSGSLLLGFTLAALSLKIRLSGALPVSTALMVLLFAVPIADALLAIIRRVRLSRPLFVADRGHLHHRLQHLGLSVRRTALSLYGVQAYFCVSAWCIWRDFPDSGWEVFFASVPVTFALVFGLGFIERLLSTQSARLSYLYLNDELEALVDLTPLKQSVREQIRRYEGTQEGFSVVLMDCSTYIQQIMQGHPTRIVNFYISLYGTLKARLRSTDHIARPSELVFAILLPKTWDVEGEHAPIFELLRKELKSLQEAHGIFQGDPLHPEGYRVLVYPRDRAKIMRALNLSDASFGYPLAPQEAPRKTA